MTPNPNYALVSSLPLTGLESDLSEFELEVQKNCRAFAQNVLRPIGIELDKLSPEQVIAADSKLWQVFAEFQKLGLNLESLSQLPKYEQGRLFALVFEELGAGDGGLAIVLGAAMVPAIVLDMFQRQDLLEQYAEQPIGCWGITEPDHGSDMLDSAKHAAHPSMPNTTKFNCRVRIDGDKLIINGQKSAWVSNGPIAQNCMLFASLENDQGEDQRCVVMVPLDLPGISRAKPLDKIGQRALPQGEIYFDNVEVPLNHLVAGPEQYGLAEYGVLSQANAMMGCIWTGCARAAYQHALNYSRERKQGGVPIHQHQSVRARLLTMFRKVEAARALSRRTMTYTLAAPMPALQGSIASKITATETAFEVTSMAVQMHGGNGVTREYPVEKLLRDARASMIEDGCNEMLAIKGGALLALAE